MIVTAVECTSASSVLIGPLGERLILPRCATGPFTVGTLGTRSVATVKRKTKTESLAILLTRLDRPIYLIDTRRDGVGAQSSWSPRELASMVPAFMGASIPKPHPYSYWHLPCLAPTLKLLNERRKSDKPGRWQAFESAYLRGLEPFALDVACAFVEAAASVRGLAIFLCAEEHCPHFATLTDDEQDAAYCHRYGLAQVVAERLKQRHREVLVQRVAVEDAE